MNISIKNLRDLTKKIPYQRWVIYDKKSTYNQITNNTCNSNNNYGIYNYGCHNNYYYNNNCSNNGREGQGVDVDIVLKSANDLIPIEIKSSQTFHFDFLKGFKHFKKLFTDRVKYQYLVYDGEYEQISGKTNIIN